MFSYVNSTSFRKPESKIVLAKPEHRRKCIIKMDVNEIIYESVTQVRLGTGSRGGLL